MSSQRNDRYRVGVRPAPGNQKRYLWTIYGTQTLFYEASKIEYDSVELALAEAHSRLGELD